MRTGPGAAHVAGGVVLILGAYGLAAAYNDLRDLEIDRANGRHLPLATGALLPAEAWQAIVGCVVAVTVAQLLLRQPLGVAVTVTAVLLSVAYSHPAAAVERRGAWATASLAVSYLGLPLALAGDLPPMAPVGAILAAGGAMLLYKDVKDETGDRLLGKRTPLVRWGVARMDMAASGLLIVAVALSWVSVGPGWSTLVLGGAVVAQRYMAATGRRWDRPLLVFQILVVAGVVGLAAV